MATLEQKKKRDRRLLLVLGGVVAAIILILIIGLGGAKEDQLPKKDILQDAVLQTARDIERDILIPRDFFEKRTLENFNPYTPVELPQSYGRTNPFITAP